MPFYTYAHTKPNGDVFYVGKGSGRRAWDVKHRNKHWHNIVNKYGTFDVKILASWASEKDAFEHEKVWIALYSLLKNLANLTIGGEGFCGAKHTEESKLKMSEQRKGCLNGMFGKKRPEMQGKKHFMHNPKIAKKVSDKLKGGLNPSAKKVKFNNIVFNCISDLAKYLNLNTKTVQRRVRVNPDKYGYEVL